MKNYKLKLVIIFLLFSFTISPFVYHLYIDKQIDKYKGHTVGVLTSKFENKGWDYCKIKYRIGQKTYKKTLGNKGFNKGDKVLIIYSKSNPDYFNVSFFYKLEEFNYGDNVDSLFINIDAKYDYWTS